ncbi:hypothetical protein JCM19314_2545 [Nonlabens ulvanivorans]|uniref:Uncharacterized protein n=1 Tax=Nonlabens ulvanivorans TaxID=906888 RepID=A0A081D6U8_NONUL|nr:hypothetical protein JCM19296_222 [Nonlabens ulvanivorans]GAK91514.1 hypothetical protein JCM19297_1013 [Nonlabens ulvanivorans]GAK92318.1 hypothetical protein JCM19298_2806 [Nonlabens ulvanivorans]GAK98514.1 hypothetical protein JCM19314_2545 [Nonlabens ulvanivorans]
MQILLLDLLLPCSCFYSYQIGRNDHLFLIKYAFAKAEF